MTNEELLQQAKDQVAKEAELNEGVKYNTWEELMAAIFMEFHGEPIPFSFQIGLYYERAIAKAIQSAREEAKKEGYKEGYRFGWENRGLPSYLHTTLAPDRPITEDEREEIRQEWLESGRDSPEADHLNNGLKLTAPGR